MGPGIEWGGTGRQGDQQQKEHALQLDFGFANGKDQAKQKKLHGKDGKDPFVLLPIHGVVKTQGVVGKGVLGLEGLSLLGCVSFRKPKDVLRGEIVGVHWEVAIIRWFLSWSEF